MRQQRKDTSRFVLVALVAAVLFVSLFGTWLVLDTGFNEQSASRDGHVSFTRQEGTASPPIAKSNTVENGVIAFAKQK